MKYSTRTIANLLNISQSTVKNYTDVFSNYLSPSASPPAHRARQFTDDDLLVLSLAAEMKKTGATYDEIHMALQNGQRGTVAIEPSNQAVPSASAMIISLREQIMQRDELIRELELKRAGDQTIIEMLQRQLETAQLEIRRLDRKIARLLPDEDD